MRLGVIQETASGETRVALVPECVRILTKKGFEVIVEKGSGTRAHFSDREFEESGAKLAVSAKEVLSACDALLKLQAPSDSELLLLQGKILISFLWHLRDPKIVNRLTEVKATAFSMDCVPRITRAQSMDALSSQATIAGYKAVLMAAEKLSRFLPMLTTAAGTIKPAQGLIIGAGVAGLQAIATARRLGAVVEAFDTRPVVKEQVLSLGAKFVELGDTGGQDKYGYAKELSPEQLAKQKELLAERVKLADFVITTAQVPGKQAPRLISAEMVRAMRAGSVIIDLAGETGGNCEISKAGDTVVEGGVSVIAPLNLPGSVPGDASRMYARNLLALLAELAPDPKKGLNVDWNNEVFRQMCLTHAGEANSRRT